jgi:hypothetical protein
MTYLLQRVHPPSGFETIRCLQSVGAGRSGAAPRTIISMFVSYFTRGAYLGATVVLFLLVSGL